MTYHFSEKSIAKMCGLHPDLIQLCHKAIQETPIDFGIVQGVRTREEQAELYAQGRTKPGKIVTWTLESRHLKQRDGYGAAIDFAAYINGVLTWEEIHYRPIAETFKRLGKELSIPIIAGADWVRPDFGHIELDKKIYL